MHIGPLVPHGGGSGGGACMCAVMVWFSLM